MIIGERLKELRCNHGLTQEKLATMLNLKKSTICTYENGYRFPSYKTLIKYVETFGVSVEYIFGIDKLAVREDDTPFNYIALTKNEIEFINLLRTDKLLYEVLIKDPKRAMDLLKRKIG